MLIPPDWLSEAELAAALGIPGSERSAFHKKLQNWRRLGLVPSPKVRHLGVGVGNEAVYPPETLPMLRLIFELREEGRKPDVWLWELWLAGYPIDIKAWCRRQLDRLEKSLATGITSFGNADTAERAIAHEMTRKPVRRSDPRRVLYRKLPPQLWYALMQWGAAIILRSASVEELFSRAASAFSRLTGLDGDMSAARIVEGASTDTLLRLLDDATEAELVLAVADCRALARAAEEPCSNAAMEVLGNLWPRLPINMRAGLLPLLIGLRRVFHFEGSLAEILFPEALDEQGARLASDRVG